MRCRIACLVALISVLMGGGVARAVDHSHDFMRCLGIGWGPGYHAYSNCPCGGCQNCPPAGASLYGWNGANNYAPARAPVAAQQPTPAAPPKQPLATFYPRPTPYAPLVKPSQAQSPIAPAYAQPNTQMAGRYFAPQPQYEQQPTYVGQRYPRSAY